jgi:hypothetical protein
MTVIIPFDTGSIQRNANPMSLSKNTQNPGPLALIGTEDVAVSPDIPQMQTSV